MGMLARIREIAAGPRARLGAHLSDAYHEELRFARQLRAHAERVPYPAVAARLLGLAERADGHAARLRAEINRLGMTLAYRDLGPLRDGRNYWERLVTDQEDTRAAANHYRELQLLWDVDFPEPAALLDALARAHAVTLREITAMIACSDPHAAD